MTTIYHQVHNTKEYLITLNHLKVTTAVAAAAHLCIGVSFKQAKCYATVSWCPGSFQIMAYKPMVVIL